MEETYIDEYSSFLRLENFQRAWHIIRKSQRLEVKDRLALKIYSASTDVHLQFLIDQIKDGRYEADAAQKIFVPKPSGTFRIFSFLTMKDRIVYQALGNVVRQNCYDTVTRFANKRTFAAIPLNPQIPLEKDYFFENSRGTLKYPQGQYIKFLQAIRRLGHESEERWILQTDIAGYYPSIDHELLISSLRDHRWLTDTRLLKLLRNCLSVWSPIDENTRFKQGIPIGYETSDLFGNLFLFDIDEEMSFREWDFVRYYDDMVLIAPSEKEIVFYLGFLDKQIRSHALTLNASKTDVQQYIERDVEFTRRIFRSNELNQIQRFLTMGPEEKSYAQNRLMDLATQYFEEAQNDTDKIKEWESEFSFIFYRLEGTDPYLKEIALALLEIFPQRASVLLKYLSLFDAEKELVNRLLELADDDLGYIYSRAHCLRTLAAIQSQNPSVIQLAQRWIRSEEWYLRLAAVDILQDYPSEILLLDSVIEEEFDTTIKASAFAAKFRQTETNRDIYVGRLMSSKDYHIGALGYYLWKVHGESDWYQAFPDRLPRYIDDLMATNPSWFEFLSKDFGEIFFRIFQIELNPGFDIQQVLGPQSPVDLGAMLGQIAVFSKNNSSNEFVVTLRTFLREIITHWIDPSQANELSKERLEDIIPGIQDEFLETKIWDILRKCQRPPTLTSASVLSAIRKPISYHEMKKVIQDLVYPLAKMFERFHHENGLDIPDSLTLAIRIGEGDHRAYLFVSLNSHDLPFARKVCNVLERNGYRYWRYDKNISTSEDWDAEESDALDETDAMMLLLSPEAIKSKEVRREWLYYLEKDWRIFPILVKPCEIPPRLKSLKYADFWTQEFRIAMEDLLISLSKYFPL